MVDQKGMTEKVRVVAVCESLSNVEIPNEEGELEFRQISGWLDRLYEPSIASAATGLDPPESDGRPK